MRLACSICLVFILILLSGCLRISYQKQFKDSLKCGMTVDEVKKLSVKAKARHFSCLHPGYGPLTCGVNWGRKGIDCIFDSQEKLYSYELAKAGPLTQVKILESEVLCSERKTLQGNPR